jgi:23S rRNA (uracil1939-C5)-methyltransferase
MNYEAQLRWKEDVFRQALRRIAHFNEHPPVRVHPSPAEFGYRFRARLHIRGTEVGFHRRASRDIVSWEHCMLLPETLNLAVKDLRRQLKNNGSPSTLRSCEVAVSPVNGSVSLTWSFKKDKGNRDAAVGVMDGLDKVGEDGNVDIAGQAAFDSNRKFIAGRGGSLALEIGNILMRASPGTFFQVNSLINITLVERVLVHLRAAGITSLLDLYCGNGNFSLPAAAAGIKTVGVESSRGAVHDAVSAAGAGCRFVKKDVGRFLAADTYEAEAVIVDPPRTGLPADVAAILGARRFPHLIYVSCEPSTLARDLARLIEAGYACTDMEIFDMFPQTSHFETLIVLKG